VMNADFSDWVNSLKSIVVNCKLDVLVTVRIHSVRGRVALLEVSIELESVLRVVVHAHLADVVRGYDLHNYIFIIITFKLKIYLITQPSTPKLCLAL
jgi:hypothetical protein